jgi:hypothetical protein
MTCKNCGKKTEKTPNVKYTSEYPSTCNLCARKFDYVISVYDRCHKDGIRCSFTTEELFELYDYDIEIERDLKSEEDRGLRRPDTDIPIYCVDCETHKQSKYFRWQSSRGMYSRSCLECTRIKYRDQ